MTVETGDGAQHEVPWENLSTDDLASDPRYWELSPGARWHGFTHVTPGYAITNPNKLILLTPGFDRTTGTYADYGIPASTRPASQRLCRASDSMIERGPCWTI